VDTHEHLLSDEDLPGHGVLDSDYARNMVRQQEESGLILWDEEAENYRPSARMTMGAVGMNITLKAAEINPNASQQEVTEAIFKCIPWIEAAETQWHDADGPDGEKFPVFTRDDVPFEPGELPDTFPAEWLEQ
jgi:hypothetical protein